MASPASIKDHPIHPMLVTLPIGLWTFALVSDIVSVSGGAPAWRTVALYCIGGGIAGALLAALPGFIDYLSVHEAEMKRIGTYHLLVNLSAVALFAVNLWLRLSLPESSRVPLLLSIVGVLGIGIGGWLGGKMVYVKGMAVQAVEESSRKEQQREQIRPRRAA